jgi:hypothetical protein
MIFKINNGIEINIEAGSKLLCVDNVLPPKFTGKFIEVLDIQDNTILVQLEDDQLSAISPELILGVF